MRVQCYLLGGYLAQGSQHRHRLVAHVAEAGLVREIRTPACGNPGEQLDGDGRAVLGCEHFPRVQAPGCTTNTRGGEAVIEPAR